VNNINLMTWYANRELDFCPKHFIKATTPLTDDSKLWIYEKCVGRFYTDAEDSLFLFGETVYFEDPQEAVLYELTWS
jgi:hypothetical protein